MSLFNQNNNQQENKFDLIKANWEAVKKWGIDVTVTEYDVDCNKKIVIKDDTKKTEKKNNQVNEFTPNFL